MTYLVISDLHSNWEALEAVLGDAAGEYDQIVCLGDFVGYGPDPNRVVEWAIGNVSLAVRGNHDRACVDLFGIEDFRDMARDAAVWTNLILTRENAAYLRNLPAGPMSCDAFGIVHGSPRDEDDYIVEPKDAAEAFAFVQNAVTFFGHTHLQGGFQARKRRVTAVTVLSTPAGLELEPDTEYLINPGSVGQPRDRHPMAAYILFRPGEGYLTYKRVAYDVGETQKKIRAAGLPLLLADRLAIGQ